MRAWWGTLLVSIGLSSCSGFAHDETLVSRYHLVAVDDDGDMMLCWMLDSGDCVGDGLGGPTAFAAGYNKKYVVVAIHPDGPSTKRTKYLVVTRDPAGEQTTYGVPRKVTDYADQKKFEAAKIAWKLPDFTRTLDNLK
jgi:hypothetical protein